MASTSLAPSDPNPTIRVYMADLTSIHACRAFAENLLEQLHGAEAEAVESSPKSRRGCYRVDVRFDSHIATGSRPFLKIALQTFPSASIPLFHFESLVFHLNCLSPHVKFYQPFIHTLIQTSLYASDNLNSASSFPRDRHAKSFLHY